MMYSLTKNYLFRHQPMQITQSLADEKSARLILQSEIINTCLICYELP